MVWEKAMRVTDLLGEGWNKRDAYQRDQDNATSGMGKRDSLAYRMDGGANDEGWDKEDDYRPRRHSHAPDEPHDVHINGKKWKSFGSHSHASNVAKKIKGATVHKSLAEEATAGATMAANVGTVISPQVKLGNARGKKSYIGSPGHSGTKAPPQPKVIQPKTSAGTAKNALDMKANVFGQAKESAVIKRR